MSIQSEIGEQLAYKKETTFAVPSTGGATLLRRIDNSLALNKGLMESKEIRNDYQKSLGRHGMRDAKGGVNGELSPTTYKDFMAAAMRRDFTAGVSLAAMTTISATSGTNVFTRAAGSWITDGLRVGDTVRMTGWTTTAVANNNRNYTIIALTALVMTVAEAVVTKVAGDSVVVAVPGKKTYAPTTGHTNDSFTLERWFADAGLSQLFTGQRVGGIDLTLSPSDNAGIKIDFVGKDAVSGTAAYFVAPGAETTTGLLAGISGRMVVQGAVTSLVTSLNLKIDSGMQTAGVLGSNTTPDVFPGAVKASGSVTVFLDSPALYNNFNDETPVSLIVRLDDGSGIAANFVSFAIPYATIVGGSITKNNNAMTISFDFTAAKGDGSNGWEATTLQIQDSLA